jgi:hypothetical protein
VNGGDRLGATLVRGNAGWEFSFKPTPHFYSITSPIIFDKYIATCFKNVY